MSDLFNDMAAIQRASIASMKAGDDNGESAQKLRRLIWCVEDLIDRLDPDDTGAWVATALRAAIAEARKP